jgi:hypothetical protein
MLISGTTSMSGVTISNVVIEGGDLSTSGTTCPQACGGGLAILGMAKPILSNVMV